MDEESKAKSRRIKSHKVQVSAQRLIDAKRKSAPLMGTCATKCGKVNFIAVKEDLVPLLGGRAAQQMTFLTVHYEKFNQVCVVGPEDILESFSNYLARSSW